MEVSSVYFPFSIEFLKRMTLKVPVHIFKCSYIWDGIHICRNKNRYHKMFIFSDSFVFFFISNPKIKVAIFCATFAANHKLMHLDLKCKHFSFVSLNYYSF